VLSQAVLAVVLVLLGALAQAAGGLPASKWDRNLPSLESVRQRDALQDLVVPPVRGSLAISFIMITSHPWDRAQGAQTNYCEVAWVSNTCVMKVRIEYEHAPVFQPVGILDYRPLDYDAAGNLIVWRSLDKYVVYDPGRNDVREEQATLKISPEGAIVSSNRYTHVYHYPLGRTDGLYPLEQLRLATGRGFGRHLGEITSGGGTQPEPAPQRLKGAGSFGGGLRGQWSLVYDTANDGLMREGAFTSEGSPTPSLVITNSGVVECPGFRIAASGTYTFGHYQARFRVTALRRTDLQEPGSLALQREVLERLDAPLPPGNAGIVDFRKSPPERTSVK